MILKCFVAWQSILESVANAPSQAHLQGTQSRHTKANLAKEPALCQRFRDTPCHGGHRHSIQVTKTKGEHITGSLLLCWLTKIFSTLYRYQPISSRRNSISFCCYLHHQFFNRQRLRAGHYKIPAQQQALAVVRHPIDSRFHTCKNIDPWQLTDPNKLKIRSSDLYLYLL